MGERKSALRDLLVLIVPTLALALLAMAVPAERVKRGAADIPAPRIDRVDGHVLLRAVANDPVHYTLDGTRPTARSGREADGDLGTVADLLARNHTPEELIHTATSVQWRAPAGAFPEGLVVRAAHVTRKGRTGQVQARSFLPDVHGGLPRLSLVLEPGAFTDPDSGIYVVGDAIWHQDLEATRRYPDDHKWWKYPGNFHYRGKRSQRNALLEFFDAGTPMEAMPRWSAPVGVRINGNNTRGFPQHALRVLFDEPLSEELFGADQGSGARRILLRASGNDQDRTFFRDALQHRLCIGMDFEVSRCVQSVLYVNGAYWGLHNIRERVDEKELARRLGVKPKQLTIIADRLELYRGKESDLKRFKRTLTMAEHWEASGPAFVDSLRARIDVEGFLRYMACNIIFANTDWPEQNGKWYCYSGRPLMDSLAHPGTDGRWHFILGDSDLSFGYGTGPDFDMFAHIERHKNAPLSRLLNACLRSAALRDRFRKVLLELLDGPLSARNMTAEAQRMRDAIDAEMPRHIARWRRPLTYADWQKHVSSLVRFAEERDEHVRAQVDKHLPPGR